MTTVEIERLLNCDRPLDEEEWGEMSIARQRGGIRVDEYTEKGAGERGRRRESHNGSSGKSKASTAKSTVGDCRRSGKPEFSLGGKTSKEKTPKDITEEKNSKEIAKEKIPRETPKANIPKERMAMGRRNQGK